MLRLRKSEIDIKVREQMELRPDEFWADERCHRCGVCCGTTDGHPCEHLKSEGDHYTCELYEHRLGHHRTTTGQHFYCVPIRELIETSGGYPGCAYLEPLPDP